MTVDEVLERVLLEVDGKTEYEPDSTGEALLLLAAEVRRMRAENSDMVEHGGVAVYRLVGNDSEERASVEELLIEFNRRGELLKRIVKYAREDRAETPGCNRLARVLEEVEEVLGGEP